MRELILVSLSAVLGYIILSAFSTSSSAEEAFKKIVEQPTQNIKNYQMTSVKSNENLHDERLIELENQHKVDELKIYSEVEMRKKEYETKIKLAKLNNELDQKLAILKFESKGEDKNKDNATFIILALLVFLLIFIYLKHKKYLNEMELEKEKKYEEMIAKKEYSEKILAYISTGNLSFDTERKLLAMLDELNEPPTNHLNKENIYHPNPDIIQLPLQER